MREVTATEFTRHFGRYREIAQHEPVAVTDDGRATGYFVSASEFEEWQRMKASTRRSRAVGDLTSDEIEQLSATKMSSEHDHLNHLLEEP